MLRCLFCKKLRIVKNGPLESGGQRYKCKECKKQFSLGGIRSTYSEEFKKKITDLYCHHKKKAQEIVDIFQISSRTLIKRAKLHRQNCIVCKNSR